MISQTGCETADGLLIVHPEGETCEVCGGTTNDDAPFQPGERVEWSRSGSSVVALASVVTNEPEDGGGDVLRAGSGSLEWWEWVSGGVPVRRVSP
jgi:hypothetical protein